MSRDQDPLTPQERTLADALAGATPRRGPPPPVDAAILASARNAAAKKALPPARRSFRRWPPMLGVAACLVVAVGIVWQLRPVPEQALPAGDDTAPASRRASPTHSVQAEAATPRPQASADALPPAPIAPPDAEDGDDGGVVFARQDLHGDPPATVDSPGIHVAWLDRIRELHAAGESEAARESLREYHRRYPGQPLPDDLDGLLEQ